MADLPAYALLAQFDSPEALVAAARGIRKEGYSRIDAYSPFPIEGLAELIGFKEVKVPLLCLAGGIIGLASAVAMQVATNLDYPLDIGGRPLLAWPAFVLISFELMVLGAVCCAIFGMLWLNRLPRLHHPLFEAEHFHFASRDRFFLAIFTSDPLFDQEKTRALLGRCDATAVDVITHRETPE